MKYGDEKSMPKYQQIALEIANRIADGELQEGDHLFGRSSVAGTFNVSPETARRAFCILADMEIISPEQGTGMRILSRKNAELFREQFRERLDVAAVREAVMASVERQKREMETLSASLDMLVSATEHYRSTNPLSPYLMKITDRCRFLGRTVSEIRLWQFTGATLVAIRRDGRMMLSPGPYADLQPNDVIYFITADSSDARVRDYLENKDSPENA